MGQVLELPAAPASAAVARRWIADRLEDWGVAEMIDTVSLLVTELVTNALLHANTSCELRVLRGDRLHVEVADGSGRVPEVRGMSDVEAGSGRGLALVAGLSDAHGVVMGPDGKRVWFELAWPPESTIGKALGPMRVPSPDNGR